MIRCKILRFELKEEGFYILIRRFITYILKGRQARHKAPCVKMGTVKSYLWLWGYKLLDTLLGHFQTGMMGSSLRVEHSGESAATLPSLAPFTSKLTAKQAKHDRMLKNCSSKRLEGQIVIL